LPVGWKIRTGNGLYLDLRWNISGEGDEILRQEIGIEVDEVFQRSEREGGGGVDDRDARRIPTPTKEPGTFSIGSGVPSCAQTPHTH
jgi:hypothetical protein